MIRNGGDHGEDGGDVAYHDDTGDDNDDAEYDAYGDNYDYADDHDYDDADYERC